MLQILFLLSSCILLAILVIYPEIAMYLVVQAGDFRVGDIISFVGFLEPPSILTSLLPEDLLVSLIIAVCVYLGILFKVLRTRRLPALPSPALIPLFILWLIMGVGLIYTPMPIYGLNKFIEFSLLTAFSFVASFILIDSERSFKRLLYATIFLGFLMSILIWIAPTMGRYKVFPLLDIGGMRMARMIAPSMFISLVMATLIDTKRDKMWWLIWAFFFLSIFLSSSKGPILFSALVTLFYLLILLFVAIRGKQKRAILSFGSWMGLLVIIIAISYSRFGFAAHTVKRFSEAIPGTPYYIPEVGSVAEREKFISYSLSYVPKRPLQGVGTGGFGSIVGATDAPKLLASAAVYPHNIFLEVAVELGLPALFCFLLFLYYPFRRFFLKLKGKDLSSFCLFLCAFLPLLFSLFASLTSGDINGNIGVFFWAGVCLSPYFGRCKSYRVSGNHSGVGDFRNRHVAK